MYRKGCLEDCEAVYRLISEMEGGALPRPAFAQIYERQMENPAYYSLVLELEGAVRGVLNLRFEEQLHHGGRVAEILEFAVDAALRGRGVGREMLDRGCEIAREQGCMQIEVACNQLRTDTHRFYSREGMRNFHYKFSKSLLDGDTGENAIGK